MKKILNILFVTTLLLAQINANDIVNKVCKESSATNYFPIGDERGHSVLTRKELHRDCNLTIKAQGACIKWEEKTTQFHLDTSDYNSYKSNNNNGSLGNIMSAISAYDQIGHLWSGWKGYCENGTKYDFSWAKDPKFWASLVMNTVMEGSQEGGFLEGSSIGDSLNSASDAVGSSWVALGSKAGVQLSQEFGKCLIAAGVDLSKNMYNYFSPDEEKDCDPVDEFCNDPSLVEEEDSLMTIDRSQYEDMVAQNPKYAEYIVIEDEQDGVMTIRFKRPNEMPDFDKKSQEEMQKAKDKMKKMQFMISSAITAGKMLACGLSGDASVNINNSDTGTRFSLKDGIGVAINSLPADWLGPYGSLIKAALSVVLEFINSFKDIDTCKIEKDAKEAGTRHLKTYETLPYNLCQKTSDSCAQKEFLGGGCGLYAHHYCCYDQMLTKILVAQIKAQLGRDWAHCTGITLKDLNYVSFRQCTDDDMKSGFDGTKVVLKYNEDDELVSPANWNDSKWLDSFQHKAKCVDLREFKQYLVDQYSAEIDFSDFDDIFGDLGKEAVGEGIK